MNRPVAAEQRLGEGLLGRRRPDRLAAARRYPEQAADQRPDRILALADAEIQGERPVAGEAAGRRQALELLHQSGLADPRFAAQIDCLADAGLEARVERAGELPGLGPAADERAIETPAVAYHPKAAHRVCPHRVRQTLDRDLALVLRVNPVRHGALHGGGDQDLAGTGRVGQPRRQVHRIANHSVVGVAADAARHHLAAGDADMHLERPAEVTGELRHLLLDRLGRPHRSFRIVAMGRRRAEHRHHAVADMLVHRAAMVADDGVRPVEEAPEQGMRLFGVDRRGQLGVAGYVGEQHRHLAPLALGADFGQRLLWPNGFLGRQILTSG